MAYYCFFYLLMANMCAAKEQDSPINTNEDNGGTNKLFVKEKESPINTNEDNDGTKNPTFKGDVKKWYCLYCKNILKNPVQTICGHRYCEQCLVNYLPKDGTPITCPAIEEDCEMISNDTHTYFKDRCSHKEIEKLPVVCLYKDYGCLSNIIWKDYLDHIDNCAHKRISCSQCQSKVKPEELQSHLKTCVPPCELCNKVGSHTDGCLMKISNCVFSQLGCNFKGRVKMLEQHHKDQDIMAYHLEILAMFVINMKT